MSGFNCTKCGACCRFVGSVPELAHLDRGDGACKHLTADNLCAIYEKRPKLCRVEENKPEVIRREAWFEANERACERLRLVIYEEK